MSVLSSLVLCGQKLRPSTNVFCSVSSCHMRHGCTFVRTDAWLDFQPGSCVPVAQNSSRAEADAVTVRLLPQLALPVSQRTDVHVPGQCGSRGLSGIFLRQQERCTTCTRSTPLTPAIPTGSIARVLVSSVSSSPKRMVMAF